MDGSGLELGGGVDRLGSVGVDCFDTLDGALEGVCVCDLGEFVEGEVVECADVVRGVGWVEEGLEERVRD